MEHLQRTGSFKMRGASNKLAAIREDPTRGEPERVVAASAGNHAQGVVIEGREFQAAVKHARSLAASDDAVFVHASDDPEIVAGQGTLGLGVAEQVPDVDTVVLPIGGGGLIGGVAGVRRGRQRRRARGRTGQLTAEDVTVARVSVSPPTRRACSLSSPRQAGHSRCPRSCVPIVSTMRLSLLKILDGSSPSTPIRFLLVNNIAQVSHLDAALLITSLMM